DRTRPGKPVQRPPARAHQSGKMAPPMNPIPPVLRHRLALAGIVLLSVAVVSFSLWLMLLDRQVRQRFAGARWALPAQVYAAPLELYPGEPLGRNDMRRELERLGYRVTKTPESAG